MKKLTLTTATIAVLAGGLLLAACSDHDLNKVPEQKFPMIEVDPLLVDFGALEAGTSLSQEVTITSIGEVPLEITQMVMDAPDDFALYADDPAFILDPYAAEIVEVEFTATGNGDVVGELLITNTDPDNPEVAVQLHGSGLAPAILIDPPVWDFGDFEVGCETTTEILVKSVGTYPLTIIDFAYNTTGSMDWFTDQLFQDMQMAPGDEAVVEITFTPEDVDNYDGLLSVTSDDPAQATAEGVQTGEGTAGSWYADPFLQEGNNWTDIIWVVDNSCSMSDEQGQLGQDFQNFYSIVNSIGIDYRIATVTTDNDNFQNGFIDVNTQNGATTFANNCSLGTMGSGTERGLKYGWDSLTKAMNNTSPNQNFYRQDAGLRVIFVSDEPDQSGSWSSYVTNYQSVKANPDHVILSAVCGTDGQNATSCSGQGGSASAGSGYVEATNATGGILARICDDDWSTPMSNLAWQAVSLADTFELSHTVVIPSTIAVEVNTVPVTAHWWFEAASNSVIFEADYVPEDGDEILITYGVEGTCEG